MQSVYRVERRLQKSRLGVTHSSSEIGSPMPSSWPNLAEVTEVSSLAVANGA
jgi:hypothetical protein